MIKDIALKSRADPMTLKHLKLIRYVLLVLGSWPEQAVRGVPRKIPFYTIYLNLQTFYHIVGQVLYLTYSYRKLNFFDLGNVYIAIVLTFELLFRCAHPCLKKYGDIFSEFLNEFHLCHFRHMSKLANDVFKEVDRVSSLLTVFTMVLTTSGVITFNLTPLYANYRAGLFQDQPPENITLEFAVRCEYPWLKQQEHFLFYTLLTWWTSSVCAYLVTFMDLVLCLMVFQIIGHIRYLREVLKHFPKPKVVITSLQQGTVRQVITMETVEHFGDQENEIIKKKIAEFVLHHLFIVNFTEKISNFFGPLLGMNYVFHLLALSIQVVECMLGVEGILRYGIVIIMTLVQLSQISIIFEVVHSESELLRDEVYFIPWESMSVSNQKSVLLLLRRMQTPIAVTAMGMTTVGVRTMGSVLKTTFSYCTFLNSRSQ